MFLKPVFPVVDYVVNYEYIATELCVNKDKPEMQCNGKCQLMKELAKAAENEKPISQDKKTAITDVEILFFEAINSFSMETSYCTSKKEMRFYYSNLYTYLKSLSVFQPPTFIS